MRGAAGAPRPLRRPPLLLQLPRQQQSQTVGAGGGDGGAAAGGGDGARGSRAGKTVRPQDPKRTDS